MPKIARELSALEVGRLKQPGLHPVGGVPGLALQVTTTGARSWILRAMVGTKRRDMGLGQFPGVTLAQAREKARNARDLIDNGNDPILMRQQAQSLLRAQQAKALTFEAAARTYVDKMSAKWKNAKHVAQWSATLETYAYPTLGKLHVADIQHTHILTMLEPIWSTKTETASRVRGRVESVLDWARVAGYRAGENPARWRGHLDKLLPAPKKIKKVEHHPAVPVKQVAKFYSDLREREGTAARALEFLTLTAARSGEVRGATWAEIDLDAKLWIVPAARMKAKKEHRVPLSPAALKLLESLPRFEDTDLLFPGAKGKMLSDMSIAAVMRRMGLEYVPHGLRSTFRDWVAECTGYPRELAERALAHTITNAVEAAYHRSDVLEKRRAMMQEWAKFLVTPWSARGKVVTLNRRAA